MNHMEELKRRLESVAKREKYRFLPLLLLVFALALGGGVGRWKKSSEMPGERILAETEMTETTLPETEAVEETTGMTTAAASEATAADTLTVYVCGAVRFPGVYTLQRDRRVIDAVEAAGGFLDEADEEYWNLAEALSDGEQIRIPTREESESLEPREAETVRAEVSSGTGIDADTSVNLNTASVTELMTLRGIGESKALAIIAYREENGPFQSIEDVMKVAGIKQASFDKIKDKITV